MIIYPSYELDKQYNIPQHEEVEWSDKNDIKFRYDTCLSCENFIKETESCGQCGCYIRRRVLIKSSNCPLSKW